MTDLDMDQFLYGWRAWFAWRPVRLQDGRRVWWRWVERGQIGGRTIGPFPYVHFEPTTVYRPAPEDRQKPEYRLPYQPH